MASVPASAWDTHTHVLEPEEWPYDAKRSYTPKAAHIKDYPTAVTGCKSLVVVQASVQGPDPAPLLDTLSRGLSRAPELKLRGLATLNAKDLSAEMLDRLHAAGIRGTRMQLMAWGHGAQAGADAILSQVRAFSEHFARLGWVVSIFCPLQEWARMADDLRKLDPRVKIVADHCGGVFPGDESKPEFQTFLGLVRDRIHVKLSGLDRLYHGHAQGIDNMEPIVKALVRSGPDKVIYGSDWPHVQLGASRQGKTDQQRLEDVQGFRDVPTQLHLDKLRQWIHDDGIWRAFFVDTPTYLFQ